MKKNLLNVTLAGVDCLDVQRLVEVSKICQKGINFGAVKILTSQSHSDRNIVKIPHQTYEQISEFLIKKLNDYIETDYVLIIEHDGYILNPDAWTDLFFKFDYIGAPWSYSDYKNVGNGGFSLRSKKLCEILADDTRIVKFHGEDHHICRTYRELLEGRGVKFAPECVARKFSFEGNPRMGLKWNGEFGFHGYRNTNLDNWPVHKNTNWFLDFRFILRFKSQTQNRLKRKLETGVLDKHKGVYLRNYGSVMVNVETKGDVLCLDFDGRKTLFNSYEDFIFFSDRTEEIIEFGKYGGREIMILYKRGMFSIFNSSYYYKRLPPSIDRG